MKDHISRQGRTILVVFAILLAGSWMAAPAEAGIYVKVDGLVGPETVLGEAGYHKALSWSWGETNAGAGSGGGILNDLSLVLPLGSPTPKLLEILCNGSQVATVKVVTVNELSLGTEPETTAFIIKMDDVFISSYQTGGSSGDEAPVCEVTLNFSKIKSTHQVLFADGSVKFQTERECTNPARTTK